MLGAMRILGPNSEYFPDGGGDPVPQYSKISLHTAGKAGQQLMATCLDNLDSLRNEEVLLARYQFHVLTWLRTNVVYQAVKTNIISIVGLVEDVREENDYLGHFEEDSDTSRAAVLPVLLRVTIGESLFRLLLRYDKSVFAQAYDLVTIKHHLNKAAFEDTVVRLSSDQSSDSEEEVTSSSNEQKLPNMNDFDSDGYSSTQS